MDPFPPTWEVVVRVLAAVLGAGLLGWERGISGKPAGLRTHMMVGLGSVMFTLAALKLYLSAVEQGTPRVDPMRVIQGVVEGIGFLGAGAILQGRGSVHGITTAATIWVVGALGAACALGYYSLAIINVVLALVILRVLGYAERWLYKGTAAAADDGEPAS